MSDLALPFVPPDADCRKLGGFMLNVERLLTSELWALSSGDEMKAALALWCAAWKQIPAGSLPDNDKVIAFFSGAGRRWRKVRAMAMRGFVKCSDGRLYHPVLCEDVLRALDRQKQYRDRREKDAERLRKWRGNDDETPSGNDDETTLKRVSEPFRNADETRKRQGQGQEGSPPRRNPPTEGKEESPPLAEEEGPARRANGRHNGKHAEQSSGKWQDCSPFAHLDDPEKPAPEPDEPFAWPRLVSSDPAYHGRPEEVPMQWVGETYRERPTVDGYREVEAFGAYWTDGKGAGTKRTLRGWRQAWRNWHARARAGPDTSWVDRYGHDRHLHGGHVAAETAH